ncbi:cation:proton antiporter [Criblamydia sequanensis]|uniref:cation:proton antiporter n=1 Tax=Candidatus Criblamydia sequanensis TaxID=340071 RepID=UPI001378C83D|nr:monovalent cation/H(+) antiporter subunit G [Criblamydia sequanensis]
MNELLVAFFLLSGVFFILIANLGILIMPDVICRAHALSKAVTLGFILMLIGLWIHLGTEAVNLKVLLTILFQFITIPLSSHLFIYYVAYKLKKLNKS